MRTEEILDYLSKEYPSLYFQHEYRFKCPKCGREFDYPASYIQSETDYQCSFCETKADKAHLKEG